MKTKKNKLLIEDAAQILTMRGEGSGQVGLLEHGWLYVQDGKIQAIGTKEEVLPAVPDGEDVVRVDASGKVVTPGLIDCHTHVVFGGSRVEEYTVKLTDSRPEALAQRGIQTGIYASVNMTRDVPVEELAAMG